MRDNSKLTPTGTDNCSTVPMRCERSLRAAVLYSSYRLKRALRRSSLRDNLANERVVLRELLRRFPYWAAGHIRLGFVELSLSELSGERVEPRLLAAVDVSAQAALELISNHAAYPRRALVEANFLRGRVLFLRKSYQEALQKFKFCLDAPRCWLIGETVHNEALEYAGASALSLGQDTGAREYFRRITPSKRNSEVQLMLQRLESSDRI